MDRRRFIVLGTAGSVAVLTGCGGGGGASSAMSGGAPVPAFPPSSSPTPPGSPTALTPDQPLPDLDRLANASAAPSTLEGTLVAQRVSKTLLPGSSTEFWTYNARVPGPLIDVFEVDTVRIRLENRRPQDTTDGKAITCSSMASPSRCLTSIPGRASVGGY